MRLHRWLFNPLGSLQTRYRATLNQFEQDLEEKTLSLPPVAPWTQRLTQVMLVGIAAGVGWSIVARVDVVVNAVGRLEPLSQSQVIQSRVGGVVTAVLVEEGESVEQGQLLMQLDKTNLQNQLQSLLIQREQLVEETGILRLARQGQPMTVLRQYEVQLAPELMNRIQMRMLLIAKLTGNPEGLTPEQRQRYELFEQQLRDRHSISRLANSGLESQMGEIDTQLTRTNFQLNIEQELLTNLEPLVQQGALSRAEFLRRMVDVNSLQSQINQQRLQQQQLAINRLQVQTETRSVMTSIQQELQSQLAQLDADMDETIKENQRELLQVMTQLNQIELDLKNQDLRAPVAGVVFNLGPKLPGIVTRPGETLLQVVPDEALTVRVQVANNDIANIRVGMPVDVRIDAYPFTEYGSVKGVVSRVGSEALAVNESNAQQTVFPVEVRLDQQFLERGSQRFSLTPGMSVIAMIRVRQRAPISYVTEEIIKAFDGMQSVR